MDHDLWLRFTLATLATWRVTHLMAAEDGPWDLVVRLRLRLGDGFFGQLMDCFYCLSLWIAAPAAFVLMGRPAEWPLWWFALSGAACLLERITDKSAPTNPVSKEESNELLR